MIKNYICIFFLSLTVLVTASDHGISNMAEETLLTHKTPTCGCCKEWIKHIKKDGFNTYSQDHDNLETIKEMYGIKPKYRSCHTAVSTDGYIFEGHILVST